MTILEPQTALYHGFKNGDVFYIIQNRFIQYAIVVDDFYVVYAQFTDNTFTKCSIVKESIHVYIAGQNAYLAKTFMQKAILSTEKRIQAAKCSVGHGWIDTNPQESFALYLTQGVPQKGYTSTSYKYTMVGGIVGFCYGGIVGNIVGASLGWLVDNFQ